MKVTLRDEATGQFFAEGRWVSSAKEAKNFPYSDLAEQRQDELDAPTVKVFYIFRDYAAVA